MHQELRCQVPSTCLCPWATLPSDPAEYGISLEIQKAQVEHLSIRDPNVTECDGLNMTGPWEVALLGGVAL